MASLTEMSLKKLCCSKPELRPLAISKVEIDERMVGDKMKKRMIEGRGYYCDKCNHLVFVANTGNMVLFFENGVWTTTFSKSRNEKKEIQKPQPQMRRINGNRFKISEWG